MCVRAVAQTGTCIVFGCQQASVNHRIYHSPKSRVMSIVCRIWATARVDLPTLRSCVHPSISRKGSDIGSEKYLHIARQPGAICALAQPVKREALQRLLQSSGSLLRSL
jgi:hypothetical protein